MMRTMLIQVILVLKFYDGDHFINGNVDLSDDSCGGAENSELSLIYTDGFYQLSRDISPSLHEISW